MTINMKQFAEKFGVKPEQNGNTRTKTPVFRSSYAFVHEPRETPNGDMKYQLCMIFNKDDIKLLKPVAQAVVNACASRFGLDINKWPKNLKCPMRDGDEERDNPEYENTFFMNCGNKNKPGIVDRNVQPIQSTDEFYSGCFARASLSLYSYDVKGNKGVGTGLNNIMFWEDGDRLDGSVEATDDFSEYKEAVVEGDDPKPVEDDDIPF